MRFKKILPFLLIAALCLAAYLPALSAGYIWDDDQYVTENPNLNDLAGLSRTWGDLSANSQYYPLVFTGFYLEKKMWGTKPFGFHLVNVLFHIACCCLLFVLLRRLSFSWAFAAALLFALHPICVESVAWVAERKNVQSGFFYLLSAYFLFSFFKLDEPGASARGPWRSYLLGFAFFAMAVLSKTVAASLPAAMLLLLWYRRGRLVWHEALVLLPFFALGISLGTATAWVEYTHVGARGVEAELSFAYRLLVAGKNFWFYPGKVFWPTGFCFNYPRWVIDTGSPAQYAWPAAAAALVLALFLLRKKIGRGPFSAVCFYSGTLFPALGFVDVFPFRFSFVADHFAYLPAIGLICIMAAAIYRLPKRPAKKICLALVAAFLFFQTITLAASYRDEESLWRHTLRVNPDSSFARRHLAYTLALSGDMDSAQEQMYLLFSRHPKEQEYPNAEAAALSDLGVILAMKGNPALAYQALERASILAPDYPKARHNLGALLLSRQIHLPALANFEAALRVQPDYFPAASGFLLALDDMEKSMEGPAPNDPRAVAMYEMGLNALKNGNPDQAEKLFREALHYQPGYTTVRLDLGALALARGRLDQAEEEIGQALSENPDSAKAHMNMAAVLAEKKDFAGAEAELRKAVELNPYWPKALLNLAVIMNRLQKPEEAAELAQKARDLSDFIGGLYIFIGRTMVENGRSRDAILFLHKGLALREEDAEGLKALAQAYWNTGKQDLAGQYMDVARFLSRKRQGAAPAPPETAPQ